MQLSNACYSVKARAYTHTKNDALNHGVAKTKRCGARQAENYDPDVKKCKRIMATEPTVRNAWADFISRFPSKSKLEIFFQTLQELGDFITQNKGVRPRQRRDNKSISDMESRLGTFVQRQFNTYDVDPNKCEGLMKEKQVREAWRKFTEEDFADAFSKNGSKKRKNKALDDAADHTTSPTKLKTPKIDTPESSNKGVLQKGHSMSYEHKEVPTLTPSLVHHRPGSSVQTVEVGSYNGHVRQRLGDFGVEVDPEVSVIYRQDTGKVWNRPDINGTLHGVNHWGLPGGIKVICELKCSNTAEGVKKTLGDFATVLQHFRDASSGDLLLLYISPFELEKDDQLLLGTSLRVPIHTLAVAM